MKKEKHAIPNISYGFYKVTLKSFGIDVREVPLKRILQLILMIMLIVIVI